MKAARALKRVAIVGMMAAVLTIGSTFTQPVATVSASVLPGSVVSAQDIGYPTCTTCRVQGQEGASPSSSGDIGYPTCTTCTSRISRTRPLLPPDQEAIVAFFLPASGDIGYPRGCGSGCI